MGQSEPAMRGGHTLVLVVSCLAGPQGMQAKEFWWMKEAAFNNPIQARSGQGYGGGEGDSPGPNTISTAPGGGKSNQGNEGNLNGVPNSKAAGTVVLPATQGLVEAGLQGASCPSVGSAPSLAACVGRNSDCWSVGMPDVDCINNALCCFDGCANVCQGEGPRLDTPKPQFNARGQARQNNNKNSNNINGNNNINNNKNKPSSQNGPVLPNDDANVAVSSTKGENGNGLLFPLPKSGGSEYTYTNSPSGQSDVSSSNDGFPQKMTNIPQNNLPQQQSNIPQKLNNLPVAQNNYPKAQINNPQVNNQNGNSATQRPFIKCPSATICTPKKNCDLEGVITENEIEPNPVFEELRVPLNPCINRKRGNMIDVCCRDPNYKDPWPSSDNQQGMNGNNRKQNSNRGSNGNGNKNIQSNGQNGRKTNGGNIVNEKAQNQRQTNTQPGKNKPIDIKNNPFISNAKRTNANEANQGVNVQQPKKSTQTNKKKRRPNGYGK